MRYFLTGGTGFIGGVLARQLAEAGHQLVALVRDPGRADALAQLGAELHQGDITDKESMRAPMEGADGVFHLAAWYRIGARDQRPAYQINVRGTRHVLQLVRELGIPKAVYTSTLAVFSDTGGRIVDETYRHDGPFLSEYDKTKWRAHYQVAEPIMKKGLPLVILQPGVVYGPGDPSSIGSMLRDFLRGRLPMVPKRSAYCWSHVEDAARAHVLCMEKGRTGEAYIAGGPVHTLEEALETAAAVTGRRPPPLRVPPAVLRGLSTLMRPVAAVLPVPSMYHPETLRVAAGNTYIAESEKIRRELGWEARPLEDGLRETLEAERRPARPE